MVRKSVSFLFVTVMVFTTILGAHAGDIDCSQEVDNCLPQVDPCRCDLATTLTVNGPETLVDGSTYVASGGRPNYHYEISSGVIDSETGEVTGVDQCIDVATVTAVDACFQEATLSVQANDLSPFDAGYVGNNCFGAVGGVSPYYGEFSCGETNGLCITSFEGCCGRESMRIYDSCGNEITYHNSFGTWSTIFSGCADPSEPTTTNCFPDPPYTGCDWTYTGSDSRFIVTDWVPVGSNCSKYKVIQTVSCQ